MMEIKHLKKTYGGLDVLKDINAKIEKGEIICLIGPSGSGKTTFLRCLNLMEKPDAGEIVIDGKNILEADVDVSSVRAKMGMVFQHFNLFSNLTVLENITVAPKKLLKISEYEAVKKALELLQLVGLQNKAHALPSELSGGQQQRVAIARALAMNPEIILFDEPTSALDPTMVDEVLNVISQLAKTGITMIIVTHAMRFAKNIADKVFFMDEGIIYEEGTAKEIFDAPKKRKTMAFIHRLDMKCFILNRDDFDFQHYEANIEELVQRNGIYAEIRNHIRKMMKVLVHEILFPISETLDLRLFISKVDAKIMILISWDGDFKNPLDDKNEYTKLIHSACKHIVFNTDEFNHPQLTFTFMNKR